MQLKMYQAIAKKTAIYPDKGRGTLKAISYCALGLAGEAGEIANKVKKLLRDGDSSEKRKEISAELGDELWYWIRLCAELKVLPATVMRENAAKLLGRLSRGTIGGSGESR